VADWPSLMGGPLDHNRDDLQTNALYRCYIVSWPMFCHTLPRRRHLRRRRLSAVANRRVVRVRASLLGQLQAASWGNPSPAASLASWHRRQIGARASEVSQQMIHASPMPPPMPPCLFRGRLWLSAPLLESAKRANERTRRRSGHAGTISTFHHEADAACSMLPRLAMAAPGSSPSDVRPRTAVHARPRPVPPPTSHILSSPSRR